MAYEVCLLYVPSSAWLYLYIYNRSNVDIVVRQVFVELYAEFLELLLVGAGICAHLFLLVQYSYVKCHYGKILFGCLSREMLTVHV